MCLWIKDHEQGMQLMLCQHPHRLKDASLINAGAQNPEHVALEGEHRQCQQAHTSQQIVFGVFFGHVCSTCFVILVRGHPSASFTFAQNSSSPSCGRAALKT